MRAVVLVAGGVVASGTARADVVLAQHSSWNEAHTLISTDLDLARADGSVQTVRVLGGTVDGISMVQFSSGPSAFVRTRTDAGTPVHWAQSCLSIRPDAAGTTHLPLDQQFAVMAQVIATWNTGTEGCSYLKLALDRPAPGEVGLDGTNLIKFRETEWCRPALGNDPSVCYPPQLTALTTLSYVNKPGSPHDGEILDADIEINAALFSISIDGQTAGQSFDRTDLANVLTHEVGHVVGLDHTCWDGVSPSTSDGAGNPVPSCSTPGLPPQITEATMYPSMEPGETKRATLEVDDIAGFCAIYPQAQDPGVCPSSSPTQWGGCDLAGGNGRSWPIVVAMLAIARRKAPRARSPR